MINMHPTLTVSPCDTHPTESHSKVFLKTLQLCHVYTEMGKNTSKCILIQNTKYPSNKCINTKYKILVPENVTKYNTCILYLKYRKYLFWIFHFLTIWYSRAFRFGLYNVHKALVNHTWLAWRCHTHNSSQNMSLILLHWAVIMGRVSTEPGKKMPLRSIG